MQFVAVIVLMLVVEVCGDRCRALHHCLKFGHFDIAAHAGGKRLHVFDHLRLCDDAPALVGVDRICVHVAVPHVGFSVSDRIHQLLGLALQDLSRVVGGTGL